MKNERLEIELDIIKYMYGHITHQGTRMENRKYFTSDVHFNNEIVIDVTQTSPMTYLLIS